MENRVFLLAFLCREVTLATFQLSGKIPSTALLKINTSVSAMTGGGGDLITLQESPFYLYLSAIIWVTNICCKRAKQASRTLIFTAV